jgi:hypothetical protein
MNTKITYRDGFYKEEDKSTPFLLLVSFVLPPKRLSQKQGFTQFPQGGFINYCISISPPRGILVKLKLGLLRQPPIGRQIARQVLKKPGE